MRQLEALWDSVLTPALVLPGSGEASQGSSRSWCHTTAVTNVFIYLFFFQGRKLTFPEALPANYPLLLLLPQPENSVWRLKTTIRQLCQHGHPSPGKHFYGNRQGASTNSHTQTYTPPMFTMKYRVTQPHSTTCHTCTQQRVATPLPIQQI